VRCVERNDGDVDPIRTPVAAVVCRAAQDTENAKTSKNLLCRDSRKLGFVKILQKPIAQNPACASLDYHEGVPRRGSDATRDLQVFWDDPFYQIVFCICLIWFLDFMSKLPELGSHCYFG
jgi:hypothetical protein